jgi:hypothetical protein
VLLARFVPPASRELPAEYEVQTVGLEFRSARSVVGPGLASGLVVLALTVAAAALLGALKTARDTQAPLQMVNALGAVLHPTQAADWVQLLGIVVIAILAGLLGAAAAATRTRR